MTNNQAEYIDIVTAEGAPTGKVALKDEAHQHGWYHNTIHLWLYTKQGEILLQQRSHKKSIYPLLWDVSTAGHIDAGESIEAAAIRETQEELRLTLKPNQLTKIGIHKHMSSYNDGAIKDYEFHHVFLAELTQDISTLIPQPEEVEAIKLVTISEFKSLLNHSDSNSHFIDSNRPYYEIVLKAISKVLNVK